MVVICYLLIALSLRERFSLWLTYELLDSYQLLLANSSWRLGQLVQLVLELLAARSSKRLSQLVLLQVSCLGERSGYRSHKLHPALVLGQASVLLFILFLVLFSSFFF